MSIKPHFDWGLEDMKATQYFAGIGVPTVDILAIRKLNEVMDKDGEPIPIETAKSQGILSYEIQPCLIYRRHMTPFRLNELDLDSTLEWEDNPHILNNRINKVLALLEHIKNVQSIPHNIREAIANNDFFTYLQWLFSSIGDSLGKIHTTNSSHRFLSSLHNINLAGEFLDFDGCEPERATKQEISTERSKLIFNPLWSNDPASLSLLARGFVRAFGENYNLPQGAENQLMEAAKESYHDTYRSTHN